jgi:hypothetical protein
MAVRNLSFEAANESRFFPFDDSATLLDDLRQRPPLEILADVRLRVPAPAGKYVYVGSLAVTPLLVTAVFMASDSLLDPGQPVAAVSARLPVERHYPVAVAAQAVGTGGWAAFGDLTGLLYRGQFSRPQQSLLSPLAAAAYPVPPVELVRSSGGTPLYGLVHLRGGNDLEIVRECREVPGHAVASYHESYCDGTAPGMVSRDVVVFRLRDKAPAAARNVFSIYSGPCADRPASRNCGDPQPVEFLGAVAPDCQGNITLELKGCLDALAVRETVTWDEHQDPVYSDRTSGVILACALSLADACVTATRLPDAEGRLPSDYEHLCLAESVTSVSDGGSGGSGGSGDIVSSRPGFRSLFAFWLGGGGTLASFLEDIAADSLSILDSVSEAFPFPSPDWVVRFGYFAQQATPYPAFVTGAFARNVMVFTPPDPPAGYFQRVMTRLQLTAGPVGALHNACLVANYRAGTYYAAELDWDGHFHGSKLFRIARFDGSQWETLSATALPDLQLGTQYNLSLEVVPHGPSSAWLTARVSPAATPADETSIGPLFVHNYGATPGEFGLGSNRSQVYFLNFRCENILHG